VFVQLLVGKQIDTGGVAKAYHKGDWVDVGKQTALRWIADRSARIPLPGNVMMPTDAAIVARGDSSAVAAQLRNYVADLPLYRTYQDVPSEVQHILLWHADFRARIELLPVGFGFLDKWEMAAPLWSYEELALSLGTPADREDTQVLIHDLRVPAFDSRLVFVRRCEAVEAVIGEWLTSSLDDERLRLLRAIYRVKPLVLALPCSWQKGHEIP
jgi:hypothetical protein